MRSLATANEIILSIIVLGSLMLVIHSLRPDLQKWQRRLSAVAGLLGFPYVAMELCWRFYIGVIRSWPTGVFYFAWHFFGGTSVAMLLSIFLPKKVALAIASISCVALTLFAIVHYFPRHFVGAIHLSSFGIGLFTGASVSWASRWFNEGNAVSENSDLGLQSPE